MMSIEAKIEVVKRVIRDEELLLKECKLRMEQATTTVTLIEGNLESSKKRLEELISEGFKHQATMGMADLHGD